MKAKPDYFRKIEELSDLLQNAVDIVEVGKYFLDHFPDDRSFMSAGKLVKDKLMKQVLKEVGKQFVRPDAKITNMLITYNKEFDFYHGPFFLGGKPSSFFYYAKLQIGMVIIIQSMGEDPNTSFVRFRAAKLPRKGVTVVPHNPTIQ
ncbi:hypothetical protein [Desulfonatronovibrio magnus]|uniref:hypothetical protein n=1 Tax=Desulfonatronovibrio magnus TaxID=698827 RepID=UPI0005EB488E|nr:hypothetical protein [Desulfonatronovibrio magnus]